MDLERHQQYHPQHGHHASVRQIVCLGKKAELGESKSIFSPLSTIFSQHFVLLPPFNCCLKSDDIMKTYLLTFTECSATAIAIHAHLSILFGPFSPLTPHLLSKHNNKNKIERQNDFLFIRSHLRFFSADARIAGQHQQHIIHTHEIYFLQPMMKGGRVES